MKLALAFAVVVTSLVAHASQASDCLIQVDSKLIGANVGTAIGFDCPIVTVLAQPGLSLALKDGDKGLCVEKSNDKIVGGLTQLDLIFDPNKQVSDLDDGCSIAITDEQTGHSGRLSIGVSEN